jgi:hypothetical protein
VQDTWKVTRKLTLDYGVRLDDQTTFHEIYDRDSRFTPNTKNPAAGGLLGATEYEGNGPGRCNCQFTSPYMYALGPRLGIAYQLAPKTVLRGTFANRVAVGLRQGEALGLRWPDVDFEAGVLAVRNSLQRIDGKLQLVEVKSQKSRRTITLPKVAVDALLKHRARQEQERQLAGTRWREGTFVFTTSIGTPLEGSTVTHRFRAAR